MNHRQQFKWITLMIVIALICLIVFQGHWLLGMYETYSAKLDNDIREAMKRADYKELLLRSPEVEKKKDSYKDPDSSYNMESQIGTEENTASAGGSIELNIEDSNIDVNNVDSVLNEITGTLSLIETALLLELHRSMDSIVPIRHNVYDSLLVAELNAFGIDTRQQLYLVFEATDKHIVYQTLSKNHPGMQTDSTAAALDWKGATYYDYSIYTNPSYYELVMKNAVNKPTLDEPFSYRLYLKSPAAVVLKQMSGILISSFLLLLIIVMAFVYLFHTIIRQKTEEELKADFTNNMTHELKTPISVSYAAVDSLLGYDENITEKQQKYLNIVKDQLQHLTGLVEQILTLAVENREGGQLTLKQVELLPLVKNIVEQQQMKTGATCNYTVEIANGLAVMADETHLHNMINNLVDNAVKYGTKEEARIEITSDETASEVRISVSDNGPGISQVHQKRIFDKFYRIPKGNRHDAKGHGLGLYYVYDMMKKHGGSVSLESISGSGTTFILHFKKNV